MNIPFVMSNKIRRKKNVSFVLPRARLFSSMEGMDPIKIIIVYWCIEKISQKLIKKNKSFGICFFLCLISFFFSFKFTSKRIYFVCISMLWIFAIWLNLSRRRLWFMVFFAVLYIGCRSFFGFFE